MSIEEILNLHPRHIAALRDLRIDFPFNDVEIVERETAPAGEPPYQLDFDQFLHKIRFDSFACGMEQTHALFTLDEEDTFYYVSYVRVGKVEDRVIFRVIIKR